MSWDAELIEPDGTTLVDVNYTHNCNGMIAAALHDVLGCVNALELESDHPIWKLVGPAWWKRIDGADGPTGAAFLHALIGALESDPDRFRAMNPENGWGDYDSLVAVLTEMRDAVPERPCTWRLTG